MNTLIDDLLNQVAYRGYVAGQGKDRGDAEQLYVQSEIVVERAKSELLKAIMESLPEENHSCLTHKHIQCAGCAISGVRAKLRELFGE